MKKCLRKVLCSFVLSITMILCSAFPAEAVTRVDSPLIEGSDFFIPEESATYLAEFFIKDMIPTEQTVWDSHTRIVNLVPMYNETGDNISAYTFELTDGYIVVSAYADVPDVILEWGDDAEPLYHMFSLNSSSKIIYLGAMNYYLDCGKTAVSIDGTNVAKGKLHNQLNDIRNMDNVTETLMSHIMKEKQLEIANNTCDPCINSEKGDMISDPFLYAQAVYGGTWKCNDWANHWEDYRNTMTANQVSSYEEACGPIAITNMIKMYGKKYNDSVIKI